MQRHPKLSARPGIAKLWLILLLPCIVIALCLVIEIANLWIARAELEDAMEAAALAAVKEWGDTNAPINTQPARAVGVEYARTNSVRGVSVTITENRDTNNINDNDECDGNLLFGAITSDEADAPNHVFNADVVPNCNVGGLVLFDASSEASMQAADSFGVNFGPQDPNNVIPNLHITQIVYDLQPNGNDVNGPRFVNAAPTVSTGQIIAGQDDTEGIAPASIFFNFSASGDQLIITFNPLDRFEPEDRFRFGAQVTDVAPGPPATAQNDGDGIGRENTLVTVTFSNGTVSTANFVDTNLRGNYATVPDLDPNVNANRPFVLPESPANGNGNDDQSFVILNSSGAGDPPAVRAFSRTTVPSVCGSLFGASIGSFTIQAESIAFYDCETRRPGLIRAEVLCVPTPR